MYNAPQRRPDANADLEPRELELVRSLVIGFLSTRTESPGIELDDLVQECSVHWWQQRTEFAAGRGASRSTFLRRVVRTKLLDLERGWKARKRGSGHRPLSLDAPMSRDDPDGPTISESLADEKPFDLDSGVDLQKITARLSARQRRIIAGMTAGMNRTALSQRLHISRDTLYRELQRIRQTFQDEGLAEYLR